MKNIFLFTLTVALLFIWGCEPGWGYQITRPQVERKDRHYELSYHDFHIRLQAWDYWYRDNIEMILSTDAETATLQPGIVSLQLLSTPEHSHIADVELIVRDENRKIIVEEEYSGTLVPAKPLVLKKGQEISLHIKSFTIQHLGRWDIAYKDQQSSFLFRYYFPESGESFKCVFQHDPDFYR